MLLYTSELPRMCCECKFSNKKYGICRITDKRMEYVGCNALLSLEEYNKNLTNEILRELYKYCEENHFSKYSIEQFILNKKKE